MLPPNAAASSENFGLGERYRYMYRGKTATNISIAGAIDKHNFKERLTELIIYGT
jgi:hypothetical protein